MSDRGDPVGGFDPQELVAVLDRHGVDYVVIGGVAARLHGSPTLTEDLDLTPERSVENLRRLASALEDLDARLAAPGAEGGLAVPLDEFSFNSPVMAFVTRAGLVDVNLEPAGIGGYEHIASRAVEYEVSGIRLRVAALQDIIRSKETSDRPKDRAQLDILRDLADELARRGR
ncbi:MAG TPA: hypothetical protein VM287_07705 [Egibacteraceae bacterium]|nr:hypothetical protein [Egibacteraceae bacterium]